MRTTSSSGWWPRGKLIRAEISDADKRCEKAARSEIQEVEDSRQAGISKSGRICQNNYEDLGEAFNTEFTNSKLRKRKTVDPF